MASSLASSSSVSSRWTREFGEWVSPIPYREGPLQYVPDVLCQCDKKAARWIPWSNENPSRRYFKCFSAQEGGCEFYRWYDREKPSEFLRQLIIDLRDTVWRLKKEKKEMSQVAVEANKKVEEQSWEIAVIRTKLAAAMEMASEKEDENVVLRSRISRLEKERAVLVVACVAMAGYVLGFRFGM